MRAFQVGVVMATFIIVGACTSESAPSSSSPAPAPAPTRTTPSPSPATAPSFEVSRVLDDIRHLALDVGPRHATSDAYGEAADWVADRFTELGYQVTRQSVRAPAGETWGVPVAAGRAPNVIASPPGFNASAPHRIVGAHLDTVPQAPGAEDNASGVATMLELARLHVDSQRPVRFIAFAAEEPRGPGDNLHHFGSREYVKQLSDDERDAMRAMVSLDRVGVRGRSVPLCIGGPGTRRIRDQLEATAKGAGISSQTCADNRASDHWSFERAELPSARLGSLPYGAYHSARDLPRVVDRRQLDRVGAIMTAWLRFAA